MWLLSALVDEIAGEVEMLALAGQVIEPDQRQLDLLVAAIAVLLVRPGAEGRAHMLDIALQDSQQPAPAGRQERSRFFSMAFPCRDLIAMWEKLFSYKLRSFPGGINQKFLLRREVQGIDLELKGR